MHCSLLCKLVSLLCLSATTQQVVSYQIQVLQLIGRELCSIRLGNEVIMALYIFLLFLSRAISL